MIDGEPDLPISPYENSAKITAFRTTYDSKVNQVVLQLECRRVASQYATVPPPTDPEGQSEVLSLLLTEEWLVALVDDLTLMRRWFDQ